jgi:hypothetical protein
MAAVGSLTPLFSFGVTSDVQYAGDMPDGHAEGRTQRFSQAPGKLREVAASLCHS